MFASDSRYASLEKAILTTLDGREVAYVRRRFLPMYDNPLVLAEVVVTQGDRLDLITARTLGNPEFFWRVCDTNDAMNPEELTAEVGRRLRIVMPQA